MQVLRRDEAAFKGLEHDSETLSRTGESERQTDVYLVDV